ncbi:right-handed parallel beta-helix repeat-containing protein [Streptosporangium canum]|uniref:right-handed parallel beta-helix repeat-containing protein n=1 Tax=Streptosporangium canum TaxID=324952 RepID=UPI00341A94E4
MSVGIASVVPGASAQAGSQASSGKKYYLDCGAGNDSATGTSAGTAWRTLARVNTVSFQPDDSILLRRGSTCNGVLQPQGSGTAGNPITVSAYGSGARPAIVGGGARAAVFLRNVQGWEIRNLDVSNPGAADGTPRTGIYVLLENYGTGKHYVVEDVKVHDVPGCDCLQPELENSGGILFKAAGSGTPTGFDEIRVSRNVVSGVDNIGIGTLSQWSRRTPLYPSGSNSFVPITNVHIFANKLSDMGGDGILVQNGVDSLTEFNIVNGFGRRATASHAAILAFNSDRPVIQHNEVTGGAAFPPSFAFSVDAANSDIVYQYNYSHDNNGPFMLLCAFTGTNTDGATIRYNVSQNDKDLLLGTFQIPVIANGCDVPVTDVKIYNNVVHSTSATALVGTLHPTPMTVKNNIFVGRPEGSTIVDTVGVYDHNLYRNITSVQPGDTHAVTGDPLFTRPGASGTAGVLGFRLKCGSPAIGAGTVIPDNGGHDLYGFRVPSDAAPNVGAYQGPCASR